MNEFTELEKLQAQTGQIIKGKMIENLRANDSVASGNLLRSIKVDNTTNKQNKLETILDEYVDFEDLSKDDIASLENEK